MKFRIIQYILMIYILSLISCGEKNAKAQTALSFSLGSIVNGTQMNGGITMKGALLDENNNILEAINLDLPEDHVIFIPKGIWNLYLVGYEGPGAWSGTAYCGGVSNKNLIAEEETLDIIINESNCLVEPYLTIIAEKSSAGISIWDSATWDAELWGP